MLTVITCHHHEIVLTKLTFKHRQNVCVGMSCAVDSVLISFLYMNIKAVTVETAAVLCNNSQRCISGD